MVDCLRQLNAGGIMRNCEPLRDFQKMCQVLLTISGGIMRSCESLRDFQKMCQVLLTISYPSPPLYDIISNIFH